MKLKRRDTYIKIAADKKQAMLLQRRTTELQVQKGKSVVATSTERLKPCCDRPLSKQIALTIREPPFASDCSEIRSSPSSSNKGKHAFQSLGVFDKGSTSNISRDQQYVTTGVVTKKAQGCKRLVRLQLSGCEGSYEGIKAIAQCCQILEELILCDRSMEGDWLSALSYCENLNTLRFMSCKSIDHCRWFDEDVDLAHHLKDYISSRSYRGYFPQLLRTG